MWNECTSRKHETSDQGMEFLEIADQLVFTMEILKKKDSDRMQTRRDAIRKVIYTNSNIYIYIYIYSDRMQRDAIRKVIAIATSDQSHLRESQKNQTTMQSRKRAEYGRHRACRWLPRGAIRHERERLRRSEGTAGGRHRLCRLWLQGAIRHARKRLRRSEGTAGLQGFGATFEITSQSHPPLFDRG
jgi:hypothetical protein